MEIYTTFSLRCGNTDRINLVDKQKSVVRSDIASFYPNLFITQYIYCSKSILQKNFSTFFFFFLSCFLTAASFC